MLPFFLVCLFTPEVFSQDFRKFPIDYYHTHHMDIYSGLSSDSITEVFQDSQGYIWIGSYDGIMRFDGSDIDIFDSYTTKNLEAHSASCFLEKGSDLWIGTGQGLVRQHKNQFTTFTKDDGLISNSLSSLVFDNQNRLWIGSNQGLQFMNECKIQTPVYQARNPFGGHSVDFLLYNPELGLVTCLDSGGIFIHSDTTPVLLEGSSSLRVSAAIAYKDNSILLGTRSGGVYVLTKDSSLFPFKTLSGTNSQIRDLYYSIKTGRLWIVDNNALYCVVDRTITVLNSENSLHPAFESIPKAIYEDKEGNIFIGTRSSGLFILKESDFRNFDRLNGLGGEAVNSVAEFPPGQFWIASDKGIYCLANSVFVSNELTRLLSGIRIKHVQATAGRLYISTISDLGVVVWDGMQARYINKQTGLKNLVIKKTLLDSRGRLWIASSRGIAVQDADGNLHTYCKDNGFLSDEIYDLYEDSRQRIWVCTVRDGLIRFEQNGAYQRFSPREGLEGEMVFSVREDLQGDFWVATAAGPYLVTADDAIHTVATAVGLPYIYVYTILPYKNTLYLTSVKGFSILDLEETKSAVFEEAGHFASTLHDWNSGLVSSPNALSWLYIDNMDRVWIPTHKGVSCYSPSRVRKDSLSMHLDIKKIETMEESFYPESEMLTIGSDPGRLSITFTIPTVSFASCLHYRYRLNGYDERWSTPDVHKTAIFTKPGYGKFTFQVQAFDLQGNMLAEQELPLLVRRPILHHVLFLITVVLVVTGIFAVKTHPDTTKRIHAISREHGLTEREQVIILLVFSGKRDKEIAKELGCATSTVSNSLSRIYKKLSTGSRSELIKYLSSGR